MCMMDLFACRHGGGLLIIPSGVEISMRGLLHVVECICIRSSLHSCATMDHIETSQQVLLECVNLHRHIQFNTTIHSLVS